MALRSLLGCRAIMAKQLRCETFLPSSVQSSTARRLTLLRRSSSIHQTGAVATQLRSDSSEREYLRMLMWLVGGVVCGSVSASSFWEVEAKSRDNVLVGWENNSGGPRPHPCTVENRFVPGCFELVICSGRSNKQLAEGVAKKLGVKLMDANLGTFADGEVNIQLSENVRGRDVYIFQSIDAPVNEKLVELLLMISATRRASAKRVSAVIPYYPYRRAFRETTSHQPEHVLYNRAADVAKMMMVMGVDRVIAVDIDNLLVGMNVLDVNIPLEVIDTLTLAADYFAKKKLAKKVVCVSPRHGLFSMAQRLAKQLDERVPTSSIDFANVETHKGSTECKLAGDVKGADVIIVEDTVGYNSATIPSVVAKVKQEGARRVFVYSSHLMWNKAISEMMKSCTEIEELVTTNSTSALRENKRVTRLELTDEVAETIQAHHYKNDTALVE